ncbi:MAG: aspartate aminotransferase family protein [Chloroflexi bacterium]|nr:aspartate aminotransferase family protein [Chloroflexota bacterium]MCL5075680.1 aspartate aminotransferase family protein [Chloroflexota bacterium]
MDPIILDWTRRAIEEAYLQRTPRSRELHQRACQHLPGGDTRSVTYFRPYPTYIAQAGGYELLDVDGHKLIDFLNNYTALILGHAHPDVVRAVSAQLRKGSAYAAPSESQQRLAQLICQRVPSVEKIRFCNSGTEAVMNAIRAARAFTKKSKVLKVEGAYHGAYDVVDISIQPDLGRAGPPTEPKPVPESKGITEGVLGEVLIVPFNDKQAAARAIERNKDDLAAIIIEPVLGTAGVIPPQDDYLTFIREVTAENGLLLIFDEVQTMRLTPGGAQQYYNVKPDITVFGKLIGGGFPIGAFGGREDIMAMYDPESPEPLHQSGTYNGNPISMTAGIVTLEKLTTPVIARLNSLGHKLRQGIQEVFSDLGIESQVTGIGSLLNIHFTPLEVCDYRTAAMANKDLIHLLHLSLLNRGIYIARRGMLNISTPMTEAQIQLAIEAVRSSLLEEMSPVLAQFKKDCLIVHHSWGKSEYNNRGGKHVRV